MDNTRVFRMAFASVYPHYITKAEKKGRTKEEVHAIIHWLTGYDERTLLQQIDKKVDFETFFARAPRINPNVSKITGVICGYRVEESVTAGFAWSCGTRRLRQLRPRATAPSYFDIAFTSRTTRMTCRIPALTTVCVQQ